MVRQRPRKTVEELYAPKYEATNPLKNLGGAAPGGVAAQKTRRSSDHEYTGGGPGGYIITSTTAYNSTAAAATSAATPSTGMTTRRKTARNSTSQPAPASTVKHKSDKSQQEHHGSVKTKTARASGGGVEKVITTTPYDGKSYVNFMESKEMNAGPIMHGHHHHHHHGGHHNQQQQQQQQQHHAAMMQQQAMAIEDEKDEETEEFFELIRMTVESAIGKAFSELFNRNFRELANRVDSLASDIKNTNQLLSQVQTEMSTKVAHYGEENSRHFRYLCMKSEYDKMFYQHQTMMANQNGSTAPQKPPIPMPLPTSPVQSTGATPKREPIRPPVPPHKRRSVASSSGDGLNHRPAPTEPHKTSSDDHVLSEKSSDLGMREVLEQIQRFCNQLQLNDLKSPDDPGSSGNVSKDDAVTLKPSTSSYHTVSSMHTAVERNQQACRPRSRLQESMKLSKHVFDADDEDDDDFMISSDGMSPRTEEDDGPPKSYPGGMTMRCAPNTTRQTGGGDS